jgi:hypothetical protein
MVCRMNMHPAHGCDEQFESPIGLFIEQRRSYSPVSHLANRQCVSTPTQPTALAASGGRERAKRHRRPERRRTQPNADNAPHDLIIAIVSSQDFPLAWIDQLAGLGTSGVPGREGRPSRSRDHM